MTADAAAAFCTCCGDRLDAGGHERCVRLLSTIDPPRYCGHCARRMVVQVTPTGWTARCSRHGDTSSADG